jgi:hypothetical protein
LCDIVVKLSPFGSETFLDVSALSYKPPESTQPMGSALQVGPRAVSSAESRTEAWRPW